SFPNGLAFGPGGTDLFVAQSLTMTVLRLPWTPAGLGDATPFAKLPKGFPDGFCLSADGDLYVCGSMGDTVCVFDSDGALKQQIDVPEKTEPTNCCIDDGTLYVTLSGTGRLVALEVDAEALPLYR
ncbi:MAG TPA: SMP-30/gluconolactonase/LRE family protein, partial [Actinomycetota bacterium]|nr:SMP-30/gluconolactonase/LRE family protein [Actinomycetota bacterium]